ncbi:MAG: cytochrome P450 [Pseudomonadales bacterium]|nr:cytochrome P450 [Pseudomonadales bacterium]
MPEKYPDLFTAAFAENPLPILQALRANNPVYWLDHPQLQSWIVTRYDDVCTLFKDARLQPILLNSNMGIQPPEHERKELQPIRDGMGLWFSYLPSERHRRIQQVLRRYFTRKVVNALKPRVMQIANELLDDIAEDQSQNMLDNFSYPLPVMVIAEMLGVPISERQRFTEWSARISQIFLPYDYVCHKDAQDAYLQMQAYCAEQLLFKQQEPGEDLLSVLGEAVDKKLINMEEATASCIFLLFAGHQTTARFLSDAIYRLWKDPELRSKLSDQPDKIADFVDELLRFQGGPLATWSMRQAKETIEFKGHVIKKGQTVLLDRTAANHDVEKFSCPAQFDTERGNNHEHLTFGHGAHYCTGALLAKMELEQALSLLLQRYPDYWIDEEKVNYALPMLMVKKICNLPLILKPQK